MQVPTHILAGVIVQKLFQQKESSVASITITAVTAFLLHGLWDKLALLTYCPPEADFNDFFWLFYHVVILLVSVAFLYVWGNEYRWGVFFSLLPDADWLFVHGQKIAGTEIPFYNTPHLHNFLNNLYDSVVPFNYLSQLPDWRFYPVAILAELLFGLVLYGIIGQLMKQRRNIHF